MGHRGQMIDGRELDALARWKKYLNWNSGERKAIKRKYNKRVRKQAKNETSFNYRNVFNQ